jgi:hypothetical protein
MLGRKPCFQNDNFVMPGLENTITIISIYLIGVNGSHETLIALFVGVPHGVRLRVNSDVAGSRFVGHITEHGQPARFSTATTEIAPSRPAQ